MNKNFKNILIVKNRGLGDAIMGLSSIQYLKTLLENTSITYGVPNWVAPVFNNSKTSADVIYPLELNGVRGVLGLKKLFSEKNFDLIIELHQTGSGAKIFSLLGKLYKTPYYFHNHHEKRPTYIINQGKPQPSIARDLDGIYSLFKEIFNFNIQRPDHLNFCPQIDLLNEHSDHNGKEFYPKFLIVLGVVATRETKMWPLKNYSDLIAIISRTYPKAKFLIPLSHEAKDLAIREKLEKEIREYDVSFETLPLDQLSKKMSRAKLYIGNDTGLKHLAIALNIPTYTFFGPENPSEWHPYREDFHKYFFLNDLSCRTEKAHFCSLEKCDSMICLKNFTAEDVFNKIQQDANLY